MYKPSLDFFGYGFTNRLIEEGIRVPEFMKTYNSKVRINLENTDWTDIRTNNMISGYLGNKCAKPFILAKNATRGFEKKLKESDSAKDSIGITISVVIDKIVNRIVP